jgi:thymidylate synthase (FAD)
MSNSVELTGIFGDDVTHALSAWTSTNRDLNEDKMKRVPGLLKYLAENEHHTPFEKSYIQFLVTCDTASHIHLIKHRIGVSVNGESARYKEIQEIRNYIPNDWPVVWKYKLAQHSYESEKLYHECLKNLVDEYGFDRKRAKESARYFLGYANQLTLDVSFNFRSFMHFQKLRNSEHAQLEIHNIAQEMLKLVREEESFKYSLEAFGY